MLLAQTTAIDGPQLREALRKTFNFRATHEVPKAVPDPLPAWSEVYLRMAAQDGLPWSTLPELFTAVQAFLNPILSGESVSKWSPSPWSWRS